MVDDPWWNLHLCRRTLERERFFFVARRAAARRIRYEAEENLSWTTVEYLHISDGRGPLPSGTAVAGELLRSIEEALIRELDCYNTQKVRLTESLWSLVVKPLTEIPGALWEVTRDLPDTVQHAGVLQSWNRELLWGYEAIYELRNESQLSWREAERFAELEQARLNSGKPAPLETHLLGIQFAASSFADICTLLDEYIIRIEETIESAKRLENQLRRTEFGSNFIPE